MKKGDSARNGGTPRPHESHVVLNRENPVIVRAMQPVMPLKEVKPEAAAMLWSSGRAFGPLHAPRTPNGYLPHELKEREEHDDHAMGQRACIQRLRDELTIP